MAGYLALGLLAGLVALALYIRHAPADPALWHRAAVAEGDWAGEWGLVLASENSATLRLGPEAGAPADLLARLDAVAMATPRTTRLAGSVAEGRITWVTRSALWGFPDYTTAQVRADGLYIQARSRFGRRDNGVNAARLNDWLSQL